MKPPLIELWKIIEMPMPPPLIISPLRSYAIRCFIGERSQSITITVSANQYKRKMTCYFVASTKSIVVL